MTSARLTDGAGWPFPLEIEESRESGWTRLSLTGELDLATTEGLACRLRSLKAERANVRLDVAHLQFVSVAGVRILINAVTDARRGGWRVEIEPTRSSQVNRLFDLMQIDQLLAQP